MNSIKILTGVIGNDIHVVANRILEKGLIQQGFKVCNLGVSVTPKMFIDAAIEYVPDAILIGSINGEAINWVKQIRADLDCSELKKIKLYIGGNLSMGDKSKADLEKIFSCYGFDRVYHRPESLDEIVIDLKSDFGILS